MKINRRYILILLILCPLMAIAHSHALTAKKSALSRLLQKIRVLKHELFHAQSRYHSLQNNLANMEIAIGHFAKKVRQAAHQLQNQKHLLARIQQKQQKYQQQLMAQKKLLATQIQNAYRLGREPYVKLLLNQENPEKVNRYLHYYQALNQARLNVIQDIQQLSQKIKQNTKTIQQRTKTLQLSYQRQRQQKQLLRNKQKRRQSLLQKTHHEIQGKHSQLQKLYQDKKRLENVIQNIKLATAPGESFRHARGQLDWPVIGHVTQLFGQLLSQGRLRSSGILIKAPIGESVQTVFPGKVVFASWLRGFGLLTIIQHGSNYLTLYGRNQSLYVKTGQKVKAGQIIATVGNSGGFSSNALYFEIRKHGKPINPLLWLRKI